MATIRKTAFVGTAQVISAITMPKEVKHELVERLAGLYSSLNPDFKPDEFRSICLTERTSNGTAQV